MFTQRKPKARGLRKMIAGLLVFASMVLLVGCDASNDSLAREMNTRQESPAGERETASKENFEADQHELEDDLLEWHEAYWNMTDSHQAIVELPCVAGIGGSAACSEAERETLDEMIAGLTKEVNGLKDDAQSLRARVEEFTEREAPEGLKGIPEIFKADLKILDERIGLLDLYLADIKGL